MHSWAGTDTCSVRSRCIVRLYMGFPSWGVTSFGRKNHTRIERTEGGHHPRGCTTANKKADERSSSLVRKEGIKEDQGCHQLEGRKPPKEREFVKFQGHNRRTHAERKTNADEKEKGGKIQNKGLGETLGSMWV